ncbi:MAG TPA: adenylate/guanylate cyclase domain-containing protein [Stellaceae bacterium]|nr:adenylate/guanylate cyclase domain-containing protein [Stellaceae bacterium]
MKFARGTREAALAFLAAGLVLAAAIHWQPNWLRGLETASLDARFRLRGPISPGNEIAIVTVDDASIAALGRWPFSRRLFADALERLDAAQAKTVVFDLLFAEPEEPVPPDLRAAAAAAAARLAGPDDDRLKQQLASLAQDNPDAALAAAIKKSGNVYLPVALSFEGAKGEESDVLARAAYQRFDKSPVPPDLPLQPVAALMPLPPLAAAAAGLGHVDLAFDLDGAPRYDYTALPFAGDFFPSLPLRAAAAYLGLDWADVPLAPGAGVTLGTIQIPTDRGMRLLIDYRGPRGTFPTYSFADLVAGKVPADRLRGRIVLIGASFTGNADSNAQPFGNTPMPGTERMANIIDTILARDFIAENPPPWPVLVVAMVLALAALAGWAQAKLPTRVSLIAGVAPILLWFVGAQAAFARHLWIPVVDPVAALVLAMVSVLAFRYWVVDREGRFVTSAFRHYLAPDLVSLLAANPDRLKLGGETRMMTLLFCDVRGFTSISETFKSDPQGLTRLINRFLTPMTDLIMARHGTIDKYMGDCVMAFWNAPLDDPDHADHALESALAMQHALGDINRGLEAEARATGRPYHALKAGIGINTGECVVGNMGSDQRFDYSVLGDAVNLASRLEGQSKIYGVDIIIGETTRLAAPGWAMLEIDLVAVKGKDEAVRIFALLGDQHMNESEPFKTLQARHAAFLAAYRAQDWNGARAALAICRAAAPPLARLHDLYESRIAEYEASAPGADWRGVHVAETK